MAEEKIKSVFDCNIYLRAFLSGKGAAHKCRKLVDDNLIELYISRAIFNEVKDVLTRPEIRAKFPPRRRRRFHRSHQQESRFCAFRRKTL